MFLPAIIFAWIFSLNAQTLYQCNYDNNTAVADNCLIGLGAYAMLISDKVVVSGSPPSAPPAPLSDVTAALTPTTNGQFCNLPYSSPSFTQPIYFCYNNYCPTSDDPTTQCTQGKFAHYNVGALSNTSFVLSATSGINGTGDQCLTYYYYLFNTTGLVQHIQVTQQEPDGTSKVVDYVRGSPYNGWIQRQIDYTAAQRGYKIYFDLIKLAAPASSRSFFAFDEISIVQGRCNGLPATTAIMTTPTTSTTTSTVTTTSTATSTTTNVVSSTNSNVPTNTPNTITMTSVNTSVSTTLDSTRISSSITALPSTLSSSVASTPPTGGISTTKTTENVSGSSSAFPTTSGGVMTHGSSTSKTSQTLFSQSTPATVNTTATNSSNTSTTTKESSTNTVPLAVGVTIGVLVLLVIVSIVVYWKCCRQTQVSAENIELERVQ